MSTREFREEQKKGFPGPAYLFISRDRFLLSEALLVIRSLIPQDQRDFLFHSFDLLSPESEKMPVEQIIDIANTVPFFGSRQFVVIDNVQKLLKKDSQALARYLAKPSDLTALVLLCHGSPKKETKELPAAARSIELDVSEKEIPRWLVEKAKSAGRSIAPGAAQYLLELIGPDLGMLSSELDKLMLLGEGELNREAIREIVEAKRSYNAFKLTDALRDGRSADAFRTYRSLRETEDSYAVMGAINWHFSREAGGRSSGADLRTFGILHDADAGIKTTGGAYTLELALARLLAAKRQGRASKK